MPNQDLENKYFVPSDEVINKLKLALAKYEHGGDTKGYKRAKDIVNNRKIPYSVMNRIKNYFTNYKGKGVDPEYILNGGDVMKEWVNNTLDNASSTIDSEKRVRMNAGEENMYKKTHTKDRDNANPTNVNLPKVSKGSQYDNIMNDRVAYESLDKEINSIKYLIEYMNNNNKNKII